MAKLTAIYDACVLYPAPLRDLLMHLAITGLFRARWTDQIHDEWTRNVLANRPDLRQDQLDRTRQLMNVHVLDCLVTGYEMLIDDLVLPDPNDRHVLAAAIHADADVIVTFNLADFPKRVLKPLGMAAQHPDAFVFHLLDVDEIAVCEAMRRQRQSLRNPPRSRDEFLNSLSQQHLSQTVARLQKLHAEL